MARAMETFCFIPVDIFDPSTYAPLADEVLQSSPTPPQTGPSSAPEDLLILSALLDLRAEVLVRESAKLSRRLEAEPRDANAHERAALLLGAFAMRDLAGFYTDTRPALCRLSAHLSLAHALRGGASPGLAGRFSGVLLESLVGRQRDALAGLDALEGSSGAAQLQQRVGQRQTLDTQAAARVGDESISYGEFQREYQRLEARSVLRQIGRSSCRERL